MGTGHPRMHVELDDRAREGKPGSRQLAADKTISLNLHLFPSSLLDHLFPQDFHSR